MCRYWKKFASHDKLLFVPLFSVLLSACFTTTSPQPTGAIKSIQPDVPVKSDAANAAASKNTASTIPALETVLMETTTDPAATTSPESHSLDESDTPPILVDESYWLDQPETIPWDSQLNSLSNRRLYDWMTGELNFYKGNAESSLPDLVQLAIDLDQVEAYQRVANLANLVNDYEVAKVLVDRWLVLAPDSLAAHRLALTLALKNIEQPRVKQSALYHINWLLENENANATRFADLATQLSQVDNKAEALALMQSVVNNYATNPDAYAAQANLAFIVNDTDLAKNALQQALQLNPTQSNAVILLNQIKHREGDTVGAINGLYNALKKDKDNRALRVSYARMLLRDGQDKKAIYQYEYLLEDQPNDESILFTLGVLNLENQQYEKSEKYFNRLLIVTGRLNEASFYLGRIAEEQQLFEQAISHFLTVYGGNYLSESRFRAAWAYADLDQFDKAYQLLQNLRVQNDAAIQLRSVLLEGQLLRREKKYQMAFELYSEALVQQPGNNDLLYARSLTAERLDRFDIVEQDLKLILAKEPDNAEALNALGYTMLNLTTRYNEAYQLIKRALQLEPENGPILDSYGWALYRLGQYQEALVYLRKALEILNDAEVAAHLGEVLWVMGDTQAAEKIWQDALKEVPDSEIVLDTINRLKNQ